MQSTEDLKKIASQVRRDIIRMVVKARLPWYGIG